MAKVLALVIVFLAVPGTLPWLLIASMLLLLSLLDADWQRWRLIPARGERSLG